MWETVRHFFSNEAVQGVAVAVGSSAVIIICVWLGTMFAEGESCDDPEGQGKDND